MADRDQLMRDIRTGCLRLKPTKTIDKSRPVLLVEGEKLKTVQRLQQQYQDINEDNYETTNGDQQLLVSGIRAPPAPPPPPPPPPSHGSQMNNNMAATLPRVIRPTNINGNNKGKASAVPIDRDALMRSIREGVPLRKVKSDQSKSIENSNEILKTASDQSDNKKELLVSSKPTLFQSNSNENYNGFRKNCSADTTDCGENPKSPPPPNSAVMLEKISKPDFRAVQLARNETLVKQLPVPVKMPKMDETITVPARQLTAKTSISSQSDGQSECDFQVAPPSYAKITASHPNPNGSLGTIGTDTDSMTSSNDDPNDPDKQTEIHRSNSEFILNGFVNGAKALWEKRGSKQFGDDIQAQPLSSDVTLVSSKSNRPMDFPPIPLSPPHTPPLPVSEPPSLTNENELCNIAKIANKRISQSEQQIVSNDLLFQRKPPTSNTMDNILPKVDDLRRAYERKDENFTNSNKKSILDRKSSSSIINGDEGKNKSEPVFKFDNNKFQSLVDNDDSDKNLKNRWEKVDDSKFLSIDRKLSIDDYDRKIDNSEMTQTDNKQNQPRKISIDQKYNRKHSIDNDQYQQQQLNQDQKSASSFIDHGRKLSIDISDQKFLFSNEKANNNTGGSRKLSSEMIRKFSMDDSNCPTKIGLNNNNSPQKWQNYSAATLNHHQNGNHNNHHHHQNRPPLHRNRSDSYSNHYDEIDYNRQQNRLPIPSTPIKSSSSKKTAVSCISKYLPDVGALKQRFECKDANQQQQLPQKHKSDNTDKNNHRQQNGTTDSRSNGSSSGYNSGSPSPKFSEKHNNGSNGRFQFAERRRRSSCSNNYQDLDQDQDPAPVAAMPAYTYQQRPSITSNQQKNAGTNADHHQGPFKANVSTLRGGGIGGDNDDKKLLAIASNINGKNCEPKFLFRAEPITDLRNRNNNRDISKQQENHELINQTSTWRMKKQINNSSLSTNTDKKKYEVCEHLEMLHREKFLENASKFDNNDKQQKKNQNFQNFQPIKSGTLADDALDGDVARLLGVPFEQLKEFRFAIDVNDPEGSLLRIRKRLNEIA